MGSENKKTSGRTYQVRTLAIYETRYAVGEGFEPSRGG